MNGFVLKEDNRPSEMHETFELAAASASHAISKQKSLRIESYCAPAPIRAWIYDYEVGDWVEQK